MDEENAVSTDDLLDLFNKLGTTDHTDLVAQFSNILKTSQQVATFYLEASNWNVESAVTNFVGTRPVPLSGEKILAHSRARSYLVESRSQGRPDPSAVRGARE